MSKMAVAMLFAVSVVAQPPVDPDVLEPSVANEVEHALSRAPKLSACPESGLLPFPTNGMSATEIAIRIVSEQDRQGRWWRGTNDVTRSVVKLLNAMSACR